MLVVGCESAGSPDRGGGARDDTRDDAPVAVRPARGGAREDRSRAPPAPTTPVPQPSRRLPVSLRGVLARVCLGVLALVAGVLAAAGGVTVGGAGLIGVLAAGAVAAGIAVGVAREQVPAGAPTRPAAVEAAWRTGVGVVVGLLAVCGAAAVAGAGAAVVVAVLAAGAEPVRRLLRSRRGRRPAADVVPLTGRAADAPVGAAPWTAQLSVAELGRAWVRSSAALPALHDPAERERLVTRRQQALDELERRDPAGFGRWLAAGATIDSDPARWVHQPPSPGSAAA